LSPLELEIAKRDTAKLTRLESIGANWSPLEWEIEKRDKAELIQMVIIIGVHWSWRLQAETMLS
jgi:hypothetical protein